MNYKLNYLDYRTGKYIGTHQPIFTNKELKKIKRVKIIGPDTLLLEYQRARSKKDWDKAKRITEKGKKMRMIPVFAKDHYEVHVIREEISDIKKGVELGYILG